MSTIEINGARVVSGSLTIPTYGAWSSDIVLADAHAVDTGALASNVSIGDLALKGTAIRSGALAGSRSARLVGGAGGWRKELPPKGYSQLAGVRLSVVLNDAARSSGETIVIDSDRAIGTHYARERAKAERVLNLLLGGRWWVAPDGTTRTGDRDASLITSPFTVIGWSGGKGQFEIATEAYADWQPGRTFTSPTVPDVQTISSVTFEATNDGSLRLHVLNADGAVERLRTDVRSIIRAEVPTLTYAGVWEYEIAPNPLSPGLVSTIDCTPTDSRMPALTNVPLAGMGIVSAPITGTKCRIQFVNCDPTRPECISLEGTTEHIMTTEACILLLYNVIQTLTLVNPGPWFGIAMQPLLTPAILTALAAQVIPAPPGLIAQIAAAAAQSAAITAGTAPASTIGPFSAAVAALSTKLPDVSGLFPSIGVPQ